MNERTSVSERGGIVRRYDYDDATVVVADLGTSADSVTVDVVDGTAIIVGPGDQQREFDVPQGDVAEATIRNGVVTVEVRR